MMMFRSRNEWFAHELQNHRRHWACQYCRHGAFATSTAFSKHIKASHAAILESSQMEAIILQSEEAVDSISAFACPLCDEWEADIKARQGKQVVNAGTSPDFRSFEPHGTKNHFRRHLGRHLEQLALFSLPVSEIDLEKDSSDEDEEDASNNSPDIDQTDKRLEPILANETEIVLDYPAHPRQNSPSNEAGPAKISYLSPTATDIAAAFQEGRGDANLERFGVETLRDKTGSDAESDYELEQNIKQLYAGDVETLKKREEVPARSRKEKCMKQDDQKSVALSRGVMETIDTLVGSDTLSTKPAEEQFFEQTPWADPQHPSHARLIQRQTSLSDNQAEGGSSGVTLSPTSEKFDVEKPRQKIGSDTESDNGLEEAIERNLKQLDENKYGKAQRQKRVAKQEEDAGGVETLKKREEVPARSRKEKSTNQEEEFLNRIQDIEKSFDAAIKQEEGSIERVQEVGKRLNAAVASEKETSSDERELDFARRLEEDLRKSGMDESQITAVIHKEKAVGTNQPAYTRMSRRHLSIETLNRYRIDYELDKVSKTLCAATNGLTSELTTQDPDYVLIKRWVPEFEQDFLWSHTSEIRKRRESAMVAADRTEKLADIEFDLDRKEEHKRGQSPSPLLTFLAGGNQGRGEGSGRT